MPKIKLKQRMAKPKTLRMTSKKEDSRKLQEIEQRKLLRINGQR